MRMALCSVLLVVTAIPSVSSAADRPIAPEEARKLLQQAVTFFDRAVSVHGGYLWRYSADLKFREGEGKAGESVAWVQPPGTPTVGMALLDAYQLCREPFLLEAARRTAGALMTGQLPSGGWNYRIDFESLRPLTDVTTLDDDTTQSALRFLIELDRELEFRDEPLHRAAVTGLDSLLKAQYPNGAWPQRYREFPDPAQHPVLKASYPEDWPREYPRTNYAGYYTFNDDTQADMIRLMFLAAEVYGDERYRQSAERGGDFILLAQMPEPQPVWAQQYDSHMHPAWARRFEPPAVTGGESQQILLTLIDLYRRTGKDKYLEPIPRALAYLKESRLPDGRLARFYELKTNRPLYFTRFYKLTYAADDLPTHYGFIVGSKLEQIEAAWERAQREPAPAAASARPSKPVRLTPALTERTREAMESMDSRGAWVEAGRMSTERTVDRVIETRTFARNVQTLAHYLAATR